MRVVLVSHPSALDHLTGRAHPERPARVMAAVAGVTESGLDVVEREPSPVRASLLEAVHNASYIEAIERFCAGGGGALDPDTIVSSGSWEAALRSAGAGETAVSALRAGVGDVAFVAMRPPGHHATTDRAMGFCLFNNIAIAAKALTAAGERVAIIDWDVHHGNGTQDTFFADPDVLYVSWHESPAYPGTGLVEDIGTGAAAGTTVNFPWPTGTGGEPYLWTMDRVVLPILRQFGADWVLVSAGYDAHALDPLAGLRLRASDYEAMAGAVAAVVPRGRLVFFLEGGYDLDAVRTSVAATLRGADAQQKLKRVELGDGGAWNVALQAAATASVRWDFDEAPGLG